MTPPSAVNLWKYFHRGLQFGEPNQSRIKHAALIPPYSDKKKMDTIGATASNEPISIAITHKKAFKQIAQIAFLENTFKNGIISSPAKAINSFGDPAKDCNAAPRLETIIPACTTNLKGHATSATKMKSLFFNVFVVATIANKNTNMKYPIVVVICAANVPFGILLEGSFKSPDLFEPAIMPVQAGKKIERHTKKDESFL